MRVDLKLAAFAFAHGFTLSTDRSASRGETLTPADFNADGVPCDGLQFERAGVFVWLTSRGWRVAQLQGERFPRPEMSDFHGALLPALRKAIEIGGELSAP